MSFCLFEPAIRVKVISVRTPLFRHSVHAVDRNSDECAFRNDYMINRLPIYVDDRFAERQNIIGIRLENKF